MFEEREPRRRRDVSGDEGSRSDFDALWRWLRQPWSEIGIIVPMIAALAMPSLLLSSGARFEQAVTDSVATQVVDQLTPAEAGLTLTLNGRFLPEDIFGARSVATDRLARVDELGESTRTLYTGQGRGVVLDNDHGEPEQIRASSRFFARAGAIESLEIIEVDHSIRGAFVSQDLANRTGATTGSLIDVEIEGSGAVVEVEGIYRDLWPVAPEYWDTVPAGLTPRFSPVFNTPNFELIILRENEMNQLGVPGTLRIDSPVVRAPQTLDDLERLAGRYRAIERDLAGDAELVEALEAFAGLDTPIPTLQSSTPEALTTVRAAVRRLDQPLLAAQAAGLGLGFLVVVAAATFTARRQATQLRLMANGPRGGIAVGLTSCAQYLAPAIVGAVLGVAVSRFTTGLLVPGDTDPQFIDNFTVLVGTIAVSLAVIGVVRGWLAVMLARGNRAEAGAIPLSVVLLLMGATAAAWFQVGRSSQASEVDPLVVAFPIIALCASLGVLLVGVRWLIQRAQQITGGVSPVAVFAIRRIGRARASVLGLAGALGIAIGIIVFATVVSDTQSLALESKTVTQVGGQTTAVLRAGLRDVALLPDDTTTIYTWSTRLTPGSDRVMVVALDPATFASVVDWPQSFGKSATEVVSLLTDGSTNPTRSDHLRAITLTDRSLPLRGAVGTVATYGYEIVGEVDSFPFATASVPVILIDATALDRAGRVRFESDLRREFGDDVDLTQFETGYESPLRTFRANVVSQRSGEAFTAQLSEAGIGVRDVVSRIDLSQTVDEQATRWAFGYLRFVGVVAVIVVLVATVLATAEQSEQARLRARMAPHIGIPQRVSFAASMLEGTVLAAIALVGGIATSLLVARRVMERFDPLSDIPPAVELSVSVSSLVIISLILLSLVSAISFIAEWRIARGEAQHA